MSNIGQPIKFAVAAAPGEKLFVMSIVAFKREPTDVEDEYNLMTAHVPTIYSASSHEAALSFGYELARKHYLEADGWYNHDVVATEINPRASDLKVIIQQ